MAERPFKRLMVRAGLRSFANPIAVQNAIHEIQTDSAVVAGKLRTAKSPNLTEHEFASGRLNAVGMRLVWLLQDSKDNFLALLARERDVGSLFNLTPVILGLGILTYFSAGAEPIFAIVLLSFLVSAALALRINSRGTTYLLVTATAIFFLGMTAAQLRTQMISGPMVTRQITGEVGGVVIGRDMNSRGSPRYLIRPDHIEGHGSDNLPRCVRLSAASRHVPFEPGEQISGIARIQGFSGPAHVNGFDFSFTNWFDGLGGTGFFMGKPKPGNGSGIGLSIADEVAITINRLRLAIARRVLKTLPKEEGGIAVALMIGDRSAIPIAAQESLRKSGLAHILAISGLHMALVTLTVLWTLRALFAFSSKITLNYPTRKWAAAGGLAAATLYLFLSGGAVATFRSWIMLTIMITAIFLDRKALTIRNVVLAAIVVLLVSPESLLEPGFQMSFAAAGALVAAYWQFTQWRSSRAGQREYKSGFWTAPKLIAGYLFGLMFTSIVAGLATGIFAAWHFHRIAPLGLMSNLLAMPIVSILVMPMVLVSALLMPYGLESAALTPLQKAINLVVNISDWVNTFPVPAITGVQPIAVLACGAGGLLLLILLRTRLRLLGLVPIAFMALFVRNELPPDIVISQDGRTIGARDADDRLALAYPRRNRFVRDIWLRAWSGNMVGKHGQVFSQCDKESCIGMTPQGLRFEIVYAPSLLKAACQTADILIAPRLWWADCERYSRHDTRAKSARPSPEIILTRLDFEKFGTHEIRLTKLLSETTDAEEASVAAASTNPNERQVHRFNLSGLNWQATINTALSDAERPWNNWRLALEEPKFPRRANIVGELPKSNNQVEADQPQ
ncbi:MAG: ComEC/Rec2 family competence protein [Pseudomonadota bacterium]